MIKKLFNAARGTVTRSVDDVMSAFTKTIDELEAVQRRESARSAQLQEEAHRAMTQASEANAESIRAACLSNKLRDLTTA